VALVTVTNGPMRIWQKSAFQGCSAHPTTSRSIQLIILKYFPITFLDPNQLPALNQLTQEMRYLVLSLLAFLICAGLFFSRLWQ